MSWRVVCDDSFTHADTSVGGAGTTTGVPTTGGATGPWKDQAGSLFSIASDSLKALEGASNGFLTQILTRPSAEDSIGQQISLTYGTVPTSGSGDVMGVGLRWQSSNGNYYLCIILDGGGGTPGSLQVYKIVSGAATTVFGPTAWSTAMVSGHVYTLTFTANVPVSGTTTLDYLVHDDTANSVSLSGSTTDSETTLQGTGSYGVVTWAGFTGFPASLTATRVTTSIPAVPTDFSVSGSTSLVASGVAALSGILTVSASTSMGLSHIGHLGGNISVSASTSIWTNGWDLPLSTVNNFPHFYTPSGPSMPWRLCIDDNFHNTRGSLNGPPGNHTSVPTGGGQWIDYQGDGWRIAAGGAGNLEIFEANGALIGYNPGSSITGTAPLVGPFLGRPSYEDSAQQWVIVTTEYFPVNPLSPYYRISYGNTNRLGLLFRYNRTNGACYHLEFTSDGDVNAVHGGVSHAYTSLTKFYGFPLATPSSIVILDSDVWQGRYVPSQYDIQVILTGPVAGVSTFTITVSDTATGVVMYNRTVTDSDTQLAGPGAFLLSYVAGVGSVSQIGTGATIQPGDIGDTACSAERVRSFIPFVPTIYPGTGSAFVTVASLGSEHALRLYNVSAMSSISVVSAGTEFTIGNKPVSGSTAIALHSSNSVIDIGLKFLSATTFMGLAASDTKSRDAASTGVPSGIITWDSAQGYTSPIHFSLYGVFSVHDDAEVLRVGNRTLSAHTSIVISDLASSPTSWHVAGKTSMAVKSVASYIDNKALVVSASTAFSASDVGSYHLTGPCSAATTFGVSGHSSSLMDRALAARTGFAVVGAGFTRIDKLMFARTQVGLLTTSGKNVDLIVSAASSLVATGSSKTNMDWSVAATTSIGTSDTKVYKPLYTPHGTAALTVSGHATLNLTGTLAGNTIVVVDVARATRTLNWRPNGLTLPAGGFSPHA